MTWKAGSLSALAALVLIASGAQPARSMAIPEPVKLVSVDVRAVSQGYRASELRGRPVRNHLGEAVGRIDDIVIGQDRRVFAIISVGGFLGLGDQKVAVAFGSLRITGARIVLPGATKQALSFLPEFRYAVR
jgi:sporulation protein YlmC with PRC-barrel domain